MTYLKIRPVYVTPFNSKIAFPKILLLVPFISFIVKYAISVIVVNVRGRRKIDKHIGISSLTINED